MTIPILKRILAVSALSLLCFRGAQTPVAAQPPCPLNITPGTNLTSEVTAYPGYNPNLGVQQQLTSYFAVDVTSPVGGTNYPNPPIPYGVYPAWCVDEWDDIDPNYPYSIYTGALYSTCDPNLNSYLSPLGHPNTIVSPTVWQMVNYILNNQTYQGSQAFFWDVQAAINTLVGNGTGYLDPYINVVLTTPLPDGDGYPTFDPVVVQALLTAATNAVATNWVPGCGDVYGVLYVTQPTSDQILMLEVPIPCQPPCLNVTMQVACFQPNETCGTFGPTAGGFSGTKSPAFCYQITVSNCGNITLTNLSVSDTLLGVLTSSFPSSLAPGASFTAVFETSVPVTTQNTVTATGQASLSGPVTIGNTVYSSSSTVSDTAQTTVTVEPASLACTLSLSSPLDLNSPPVPGSVTLPEASLYSTVTPPPVTVKVTICNTGFAPLSNVTVTSSELTYLGIALPPPFSLPVNACSNIQFTVPTTNLAAICGAVFSVNENAVIVSDSSHCGVYDTNGLSLTAPSTSTCLGTIYCSTGCPGVASVSGYVVLDCNGAPVVSTDSPLPGLTLSLITTNLPSPTTLATTTTDVNGHYSFAGLAAGTYIVKLTPPAGYTQTYPAGNTGEEEFTVGACSNFVSFGYSEGTTLTLQCPPAITIATNYCPVYCTFTPSDWCSPCNASNSTPTWWTGWDQQNHGYNCVSSFGNWYAACTGQNQNSNCWNFCQNQWTNNNSAPGWCASFNSGNPNNNWWVPCNGNNPGSVLNNCFKSVYPSGCVQIGNPKGYCAKFTSCDAVRQCLGFTGNPGALNGNCTNPNSCSAGSFCAQVLALQLNCDFGNAGATTALGGPCGNLVLNDPTSPCNGKKVCDILQIANCVLGGGSAPAGCTPGYLCGLCSNINQCCEGFQVSSWCQTHLTPVFNPPPSLTGTPTVTITGCSNITPTLTYCDTVTAGACSGSYEITRDWTAVAGAFSNSCDQLITITLSPGPSISGTIFNDCSGAGCSNGGHGNYWGGNNWGWGGGNSSPNFSGDAGIAGVTVTLVNSKNVVVATTVTDTNGNYTFVNPGAGTYTVVVTPPTGYMLTYPTTGTPNETPVTVTACQVVTGLDFAYMGNQTSVVLVKTAPPTAACGTTITYNFAVTNTGNNCVTLTVNDPLLGGQIFSQSSVGPGQGFVFGQTYTLTGTNIGTLVNTAYAVANPAAGPSVTNTASASTVVTSAPVNQCIYCNFNSQSPSGGWVWCNAHINCNPNKPCDIHCSGATITITGKSGKVYTYPVPDCDVVFAPNCSTGSSTYNGAKWTTTCPTGGDSGIFLSGCAIPWNSDFANAKNVCWQGNFTCGTPGVSFNWQWGAACYGNTPPASCGSINVKACQNTPCGYNNGDQCGTPENCKSYCTGGGTGGGGSNCTGSWSSTGSCTPPSCK